MLTDADARIRRRAALAVGRVGLREGVSPLTSLLADPDPEVRQMAAFALGLLGDATASTALIAALDDPAPIVQASAAEALGLIGDPSGVEPIARLASRILDSGALSILTGDDETERRDTPPAVFRLAIFALARMKAYPALASVVLDPSGQPRVRWWPVAYALERVGDPRAFPALMSLAKDADPYARAFAVKGLGVLKNRAALPVLVPLATGPDVNVAVEAVRALGAIGDPAGSTPLLALVRAPKTDLALRVEAVSALGPVGGEGALDSLLDLLADASPFVRAAALGALPRVDREGFVTTLSAVEPDPDWRVRSALASVLGTVPSEVGLPRLRGMLADSDQRVIPAVLASLAALNAPNAPTIMLEHLKAEDPMVRAAAATALGKLKPAAGAEALADAYRLGVRDPDYAARVAALESLVKYGMDAATPVLTAALADKDWAVRRRAAALLEGLDPASDAAARIRPAPTTVTGDFYQTPQLVNPPVSTMVYIDTDHGTIEIEMSVIDAPLTVDNFVKLAGKNAFEGLTFHRVVRDFVVQGGDPRGDGEGGPGWTIRDELSEQPYLRGTVGMALDGPDTGGCQFFITVAPQPHLDAKYTAFGRVVKGMEVVDQIQPGDVIRHVRVWNGEGER